MITFDYKIDMPIEFLEPQIQEWISTVIEEEDLELGDIQFTFCSDTFLHEINLEYLNHDTLTDIITFDYRVGDLIMGDIFISIDRVMDNAKSFNQDLADELHRVMAHGILHIIGYNDLNDEEAQLMKEKENWALSLRGF